MYPYMYKDFIKNVLKWEENDGRTLMVIKFSFSLDVT